MENGENATLLFNYLLSGGTIGALLAVGAAFQRLKDHSGQIKKLEDKIEMLEKNNILIAEIKKDISSLDGRVIELKEVVKDGISEIREALGLNNVRNLRKRNSDI